MTISNALKFVGLIVTFLSAIVASGDTHNVTIHTGTITDETPYDEYQVTVEAANQTLVIEMRPASGSELDTLLYLIDQRGNIVAQNDDISRNRAEGSRIVYTQADTGGYTVIATRYKVTSGKSSGDYELSISITSPADAAPDYDVSTEALTNAGYPPLEPHPTAEWTIIAYYGGDTDLEPYILADLNEFELAGGSDDVVRIVAMVDRHPEFSDASGNWDTIRIFEVNADESGGTTLEEQQILDSPELVDLGTGNSANGENLAQFLVWALQTYPAENYAVAFASHGAAWEGLIKDDTADGQMLSLPALKQAFTLAREETGIGDYALLINDACLMSSVEYQSVMAEFFDYSLASPEIVINPALDMTLLTGLIRSNPGADLEQVGKQLVDTYMNRDMAARTTSDRVYLSGAVIQLNEYDALTQSVEQFAALINEDPLRHSALIGSARSNAYEYSSFAGASTLIDLSDFMQRILLNATDEAIIRAAQDVLERVRAVVSHGAAGERVQRITGYNNIYFPASASDLKEAYFQESPLPEWSRMLRNYYNSITPQPWLPGSEYTFHPPIAPEVTLLGNYPPVGSLIDPIQISYELVGRHIASGEFIVDQIGDDGQITRLYSETLSDDESTGKAFMPGTESGSFAWDTTLISLTDGTNTHHELIILNSDLAFLEGRYREASSDTWHDVAVMFDFEEETNTGSVAGVISRDPDVDAVAAITIPDGAIFQPYQVIIDEAGRKLPEPGNTYTWQTDQMQVDYFSPAPSGTYRIGIAVTSYNGESSNIVQTVTINNDEIDQGLRGTTALFSGYTLRYPAAWMEDIDASTPDTIVFTSMQHEAQLVAYSLAVPAVEPTVDDALETFENDYGYSVDYDSAQPVTVTGATVHQFDFTDGADLYGRGIVRISPYGFVDVFAVLDAAPTEAADMLFDTLVEHIKFFAPIDFPSEWITYEFQLGTPIQLPVPRAWDENAFDETVWFGFSPDADVDETLTRARFGQFAAASADTALQQILDDTVLPGGSNYQEVNRRVYYGELADWHVIEYTIDRQSTTLWGRLYLTLTPDYIAHVGWFEAPATGEDEPRPPAVFGDVFEIMIDGYQIIATVRDYANETYDFQLQYPFDWSYLEPDFYIEDALSAFSVDNRSALWVYFFDETETADDVLNAFEDRFNITDLSISESNVSTGGVTGDIVYYEMENSYSGYGYVTVHEETGFIFAVETELIEDAIDNELLHDAFTAVLDSLSFGDAQSFAAQVPDVEGGYEYLSIELIDEQSGARFDIPSSWATPAEDQQESTTFFSSASGISYIEIYQEDLTAEDAIQLEETSDTFEMYNIDGHDVAYYAYTYEFEGQDSVQFNVSITYRLDETTVNTISVNSSHQGTAEFVGEMIIESLEIEGVDPLPLVSADVPASQTLPSTGDTTGTPGQFVLEEYDFQFSYPTDWTPFTEFEETFSSSSPDFTQFIDVFVYDAFGDTDVMSFTAISEFDDIQAETINGFDTAIGTIDYGDGTSLVSINFAVPQQDVFISIDVSGETGTLNSIVTLIKQSLERVESGE